MEKLRELWAWRINVPWRGGKRLVPGLWLAVLALLLACCCCSTAVLLAPSSKSTRTPTVTADMPAQRQVTAAPTMTTRPTQTVAPTRTTRPTATSRPPTTTPVPSETPQPTKTPEPTNTPGPTDTPWPTLTVQPTHTSMPTWTPGPTNTPWWPTATSQPTVDAAEAAYTTAVLQISQTYSTALTGVGKQATAASKNPMLLFDEDWKLATVVYLATLKAEGQALRALTPPARFAAAHKDLLAAAGHFDRSADLFADGVDHFDGDKLTEAMLEMQAGNASIQSATAKFNALK